MFATATLPTIFAPFRVTCILRMFAGGPVTWSSKKQQVVALSSCESEYIAPAYASQEAVHLFALMSELTFPQFCPVQTCEDNMGALQLSGTTAFSPRTKHIFRGTILCASWLHRTSVSHVKATDQLADLFTRFLNYPKFKAILDKIINFAS